MSLVKKLTAGMLAIGMLVAGIVVAPKRADAVDTVDLTDKVVYDETYQIGTYWTNGKVAPVKEGYVFGGWFKDASEGATDVEELTSASDGTTIKSCVPLTTADIDSNSDGNVDDGVTAYAKFVPAQVLSVKAQNEGTVTASYIESFVDEQDSFYVRVMSSLDSKNYQKVGFDIWLANAVQVLKYTEENQEDGQPHETTRIYTGLKEGETTKTANEIFGGVSQYLSVWQLTKINYKSNVSKIIYVRPYWITMDGTKVEGLAKYVHIEDDYMGYISVPVNLLGGEAVAAGAVNMTYDNGENAALELIGFEAGRILPKMNHSYTDKTIKMVGNTDTMVGTYKEGETIYANLRFKKPTVNTDFNITYGQFCDWSETIVDVKKAWDTEYVQETTSE